MRTMTVAAPTVTATDSDCAACASASNEPEAKFTSLRSGAGDSV